MSFNNINSLKNITVPTCYATKLCPCGVATMSLVDSEH